MAKKISLSSSVLFGTTALPAILSRRQWIRAPTPPTELRRMDQDTMG